MLIHRAQFSCQNMGPVGSLPGSQLFLHEDVGDPHALCHVSPSHATKSGIPWLISRSTSHLHAGNGPFGVPGLAILQPRAADAARITALPCWIGPPLVEVRPSLLGWPCLPGSTALPPAAFKMLLACQAAVPEPQLLLTSRASPLRALGPGARQSRAAVHLVVCAPVAQEHFTLVSCTCLCCTSQHNLTNQSIIIIIYVNKINK